MALRTMTVRELRNALNDLGDDYDDAPVYITADYGDRGHTTQALPVRNVDELDEHAIVETGYSNSGYAVDEDESDGTGAAVVVLRS